MTRLFDGAIHQAGGVAVDSTSYAQTPSSSSVVVLQQSSLSIGLGFALAFLLMVLPWTANFGNQHG